MRKNYNENEMILRKSYKDDRNIVWEDDCSIANNGIPIKLSRLFPIDKYFDSESGKGILGLKEFATYDIAPDPLAAERRRKQIELIINVIHAVAEKQLSEQQFQCFILGYKFGVGVDAIARKLKKSPHQVSNLLYKAKNKLKAAITVDIFQLKEDRLAKWLEQLPTNTDQHRHNLSRSLQGRKAWNKGKRSAQSAWNKRLKMKKRKKRETT